MQWELLTGPEFAEAVRRTGVCVVPMGALEKHGDHLPVGQDMLAIHKLACLAAEKAEAVVYPPWYFGQIYEARSFPGCVSLKPALLLELLQAVLDEIGRNGFTKIVLLSGHGGNKYLLPFLAQCALWEEKPYSVYVPTGRISAERQKKWNEILETTEHGHACECETSLMLALYPELVRMDAVPKKPGSALGRHKKVEQLFTGIRWYADYPDHYAGDARAASAEKGRQLLELRVDSIVEIIAAVKADKVVPELEAEFFKLAANPCGKKGK